MVTSRRSFLAGIIAAAAAPAIVRASSLMPIVVPSTKIVVPESHILEGYLDGWGEVRIALPGRPGWGCSGFADVIDEFWMPDGRRVW
jgi:hypothetical protein